MRFHDAFPDVLPAPGQIPATYAASEQSVTEVLTSLQSHADRAQRLRTRAGVRSNQELAELLAFHTEALGDLQRRCRGNAFTDDRPHTQEPAAELVRAGPTSVADPAAERCVRSLPGPTGKLQRPLLAIDTAYDPVIPSWSSNEYVALLEAHGRQSLFAREVVADEGHLNVSTTDRLRAFSSLVRWGASGLAIHR